MDKITAKTGNAKIRKLGHTASNYGGNDITKRRKGYSGPRDLSAK
jgi:hypothetical protein